MFGGKVKIEIEELSSEPRSEELPSQVRQVLLQVPELEREPESEHSRSRWRTWIQLLLEEPRLVRLVGPNSRPEELYEFRGVESYRSRYPNRGL